jgi:hypothetical protein
MDEFRDRLDGEMRGEHAPPDAHARVMAQVRRRVRRRRVAAASVGLGLFGLLAVGGYALVRTERDPDPPTPVATEPTTTSPTAVTGEPTPTPTSPEPGETLEAPPPVTVRAGDRAVVLHAYTFCYVNICVDGVPLTMPDVGEPEAVTVEFPLPGWSFTASFTPSGDRCGRVQSTPLVETDEEGTFLLEPVGYAGDYDVQLFGRGDGDLFVSFRWTTPVDGPLPEPRAYLALLANDDPVTSYGVELHLSNLAETPSEAQAFITVRAANGRELTFEATRAGGRCWPDGTVYWDGPDAKGLEAAGLGEPPFAYEVEVILDGVTYTATATWPGDQIPGEEPAVLLEFTPALPALG